jgi:hypothetical protein
MCRGAVESHYPLPPEDFSNTTKILTTTGDTPVKNKFVLDELEAVIAPAGASASCKSVTFIWDITVISEITGTVYILIPQIP